MTVCTTEACGRTTELYLCTRCIIELDDLLRDVPFLRVNLDPILQATKVTKRAGGSGGNGTNNTASRPPTSIDAGLTRQWLAALPARAYTEAEGNPEAGRTLYMARIWVNNARRLVWGAEAEKVDQLAARRRLAIEVPAALHTKPLIEWLRVTHGLELKESLLRKWAERKIITRNNSEGRPTYDPTAILIQARKDKAA